MRGTGGVKELTVIYDQGQGLASDGMGLWMEFGLCICLRRVVDATLIALVTLLS